MSLVDLGLLWSCCPNVSFNSILSNLSSSLQILTPHCHLRCPRRRGKLNLTCAESVGDNLVSTGVNKHTAQVAYTSYLLGYFKAGTVSGTQMFSLNQWSHLSQSLLLCFLFIFLEIWMFLFELTQDEDQKIPLYTAPQPYGKWLVFLVCWWKYLYGQQDTEKKSDRWEMSTLSKTKVPQVWTPIIYSRPSNPCQRAVSLWADLSSSLLSSLTGTTPPHNTIYSLSLSLVLLFLLSFSSSLLFHPCHSLVLFLIFISTHVISIRPTFRIDLELLSNFTCSVPTTPASLLYFVYLW